MKIIIAGAGAVGTHLAKLLSREKQDIILMDDDEEKLSTSQSRHGAPVGKIPYYRHRRD